MATQTTRVSHGATRLGWTLASGALVHLALALSPLPAILVDRNELTTPITSWTRLQEGLHLTHVLHQSPYSGGSFHHAPLLLLLHFFRSPLASHLLWTAAEVATAWNVARIARGRRRNLVEGEGEQVWDEAWCAALYLFHPFSIGSALARSTSVFNNLCLSTAIAAAVSGSPLTLAFALSLATHLSLYPVLLLPPLILVLNHQSSPPSSSPSTPSTTLTTSLRTTALLTTTAFLLHQLVVLALSHYLTGSWDFLSSVYGTILTIPDLTPTIGLGWYFFIEMFAHFRAFFVGVFQLHVLSYVAPLTIAYRRDPIFAVLLLVGIISIFKSYPSLGDFGIWHALLGTYSELSAHLPRPLLLLSLTLYALCLLPTFHHLWLYSGSGNANFFYASTRRMEGEACVLSSTAQAAQCACSQR
ncbi:hypothetical protein RQP46_010379 [Phenoliferia psychrophenolica]